MDEKKSLLYVDNFSAIGEYSVEGKMVAAGIFTPGSLEIKIKRREETVPLGSCIEFAKSLLRLKEKGWKILLTEN